MNLYTNYPDGTRTLWTPAWNTAPKQTRIAIAQLVGWVTREGKLSAIGRRVIEQPWIELTPAAQGVLTRHGIKGAQ